jgi:hypothetical protein
MTNEGDHYSIADHDTTLKNAVWSLGRYRVGFNQFSEFSRDPDLAERDYFYLAGNILKWYHIYGKKLFHLK